MPKRGATDARSRVLRLTPEYISLLYGAAYFIMGFAIVVRASACPASNFRSRLFALGVFGLLRAASLWTVLFYELPRGDPFALREVIHLPAYFALFYFAFGWNEKRPMLAHAVSLAAIAVLTLTFLFVTDPLQMHVARRTIVIIPATACAAIVFLKDGAFQFPSPFSNGMRWLVAFGFLTYSGLSLFFRPGEFFPTTLFNTDNLAAVTGTTILPLRAAIIVLITIGILGLLNSFDVAMRRQTRQALDTADRKLRKALDISKLGDWEWDIATDESNLSDNYFKILGMDKKDHKPGLHNFLEHVHPDDRAMVQHAVETALAQRTGFEIGFRILWPDGSVRYVQSFGEAELGPDGRTRRMIGVIHDITEITEARIAAEEASAAKSNFIANISHELRTPLNAILGFSEVMKMKAFGPLGDARYESYAEDIHKSGRHLLSIINDILSISRLEAGRVDLREEVAVDIQKLLDNCANWVRGQASEAGIELRVRSALGLPSLRGDPRLLTQILLNLLSNAVKFTPRGGRVELSARIRESGGIAIAIRDTGIGMSPDQVARIGERFLQFDSGLERKYAGTGIGLSIVKRMVEAHGGELRIESEPDVGTTVSVHMPPERCEARASSGTRAA